MREPPAPPVPGVFVADCSRLMQTGVHDAAEFLLRHRLFDELLKEEKFLDAANCLGKLNLDAMGSKVLVAGLPGGLVGGPRAY